MSEVPTHEVHDHRSDRGGEEEVHGKGRDAYDELEQQPANDEQNS